MATTAAAAHAAASPSRASPPLARLPKAAARRGGGVCVRAQRSATVLTAPAPARSLCRRGAAQRPAASAGRSVAAGGADGGEGQQQESAAAAAAAVDEEKNKEELPFADLTLRAEADGATARVHRGVLAACSHVFETALREAPADAREMLLLGKSKAELDLLVAWLYQAHTFTMVRRATP
jgi:hypothetical protein